MRSPQEKLGKRSSAPIQDLPYDPGPLTLDHKTFFTSTRVFVCYLSKCCIWRTPLWRPSCQGLFVHCLVGWLEMLQRIQPLKRCVSITTTSPGSEIRAKGTWIYMSRSAGESMSISVSMNIQRVRYECSNCNQMTRLSKIISMSARMSMNIQTVRYVLTSRSCNKMKVV